MMLEPMGLAAGPVVPTREWRELYAALDCAAVAAIHPFYTASRARVRRRRPQDRRLRARRPRRHGGLARRHRRRLRRRADKVDAAKNRVLPAPSPARSPPSRSRAASPSRGYEGSELLVARLLIESGADVPYVGTACPRTPWSDPDREWLEARGVRVQYRASLEQDIAAIEEFGPDLAIGTTPVVQHAKRASVPALYFTNLISARPLMGAAGAGSLAPGGQRRPRQQGALRPDERLLRGRRHRPRRRRLGRHPRRPPRVQGPLRQDRRPRCAPRKRRWAHDPHPRSRPRRRLLGRRLRLHRHQGPAGHHRRPGGLREPAGHQRCCTTPTPCRRTSCRSSSPASARRSSARPAPRPR